MKIVQSETAAKFPYSIDQKGDIVIHITHDMKQDSVFLAKHPQTVERRWNEIKNFVPLKNCPKG